MRRLEPGAYELLVGASSEDIRLGATVELDGEPAAPRPVRERGLDAADFDEQLDTAIVDRTKAAGDAVTPADGGTGELLYRDCDFGEGVTEVTVEAAGEGVVEVFLDGGLPVAGQPRAGCPGRRGHGERNAGALRLPHHRRRVRHAADRTMSASDCAGP